MSSDPRVAFLCDVPFDRSPEEEAAAPPSAGCKRRQRSARPIDTLLPTVGRPGPNRRAVGPFTPVAAPAHLHTPLGLPELLTFWARSGVCSGCAVWSARSATPS